MQTLAVAARAVQPPPLPLPFPVEPAEPADGCEALDGLELPLAAGAPEPPPLDVGAGALEPVLVPCVPL
jgi:hypothetical protein